MTPLAAAYDNIRLIRRKITIAHDQMQMSLSPAERDLAVIRACELTECLMRAVQDFADAGYEQHLADLIEQTAQSSRGAS